MTDAQVPEERVRASHMERWECFREEYGDIGIAVLEILIRHDPASLVVAGAPSVQYTTEAGPLCARLSATTSSSDVTGLVYQVMLEMFGKVIADREAHYDQIGQEVWDVWKDQNL
jgi:hypothetical protein